MRFALTCLLLLFGFSCSGASYWVSPTGAASWANAASATPLSGTNCASLTTLRGGTVAAGDTVYFRGGGYAYNDGATPIVPSTSGTSVAKITYTAYTGETPVITNINAGTGFYSVYLDGRDWIVIRGLWFTEFPRHIWIQNGSDCNEIASNRVWRTTASPAGTVPRGIQVTSGGAASTNNWIHGNVIHGLYSSPCDEGGDGIMLGDTGSNFNSDYNTVEYNTIYNIGHACTENFTAHNVFRGNFAHNEGFKTFSANLTGTATGGSTTSLIDTSKNFSALGVRTGTYLYVHDLSDPGSGEAKRALVASVSTTTNPNDTVNYSAGTGTPTFAAGHSYSIGCSYFADSNPPGNGMYAHRAFHLDTHSGQRSSTWQDKILFEGNRSGHAASNPGNDGADGLSLSAGNSIVRFNAFYGCAGPGLYFKNGIVAGLNHVYHNTIYRNGRFQGVQFPANPITISGVQLTTETRSNYFKNNIVFDNLGGDFDQSLPASWVSTNNHLNAAGNPLFTSTNLSDPFDAASPNLSLSAGSPCIDQGGPLTYANGSGSSSTTLIVDDALYFQDGTWGSRLSNIQPDVLAVGSVGNRAGVASINYDTRTITLSSPLSWSDRAAVYLYSKSDGSVVWAGTAPDAGAFEYTPPPPTYSNTFGAVIINGPLVVP
jgi:hypothetical protein